MATGSTTDSARSPSSGVLQKLLLLFSVCIATSTYKAIQPPPSKLCGSPDGPSITGPRIKLRDGRQLAYKEHGVPRDEATHKIIVVHGSDSCRHDNAFAALLSPDIKEGLGVYMVSFDRPGYAESDPDPNRTPKSLALDIEELADQLSLGSKFYVIGYSMGGQATWACLKYIPHRLAGVTLVAPVVNYWWKNFPSEISTEAFNQQGRNDQWAVRVAHYAPWLTHWWNSQSWFPGSSVVARNLGMLSKADKEIMFKLGAARSQHEAQIRQQGTHETLHRDMIVGFGTWEFDPMELENLFPNNEGSVHLWQGDDDVLVPVTLQRYIAKKLPWIHYHEIPGAGHLFPFAPGMVNNIVKTLLTNDGVKK
ncbi:alpha/beta-Hydrolases superfamily protein [Arabidopsis thaliana]|jgi:pimeloyl-ACP methyl ester carboxylesterase|uniref:Alpha/beta-Hydrolases superfamily protein n=1 Tax=Arabidopsis thaliana TaxID=3702 RepID=Q9SJM9_ARATH|nr:alpha/beta-Hydrolases superfamily protein [Arabidopsis thaliana]AAD21437.1 expressed protein [Arabidopsis thaliana]AEC09227.1 alpha/beta-Hydrolases superfamily protein [Arabidopsis thaliana]|eukprot:NP_565841.1 alpha/beta-Hydrolases superfamily protein [Arabidopsis thaliana]